MKIHRLGTTLALSLSSMSLAILLAVPAIAADPALPLEDGAALGAADGDHRVEPWPGEGVCSRTARMALRGCWHEIEEDYWIESAKCYNLADEEEREVCLEEAEVVRSGEREFCRDQFDARREVCDLLGEDPYDPKIEPGNFLSPEEIAENPNPYMPLIPGARWVYEGGDEEIEVTVTEETREILGVECIVVRDVVTEDDEPIEDTDDYFTQDEDGNVWYFGEISKNFEDGYLVSLEGSWLAGEDGAKPGIVMEAEPEVGDAYRQEFLLEDAEDLARVLSTTGTEEVPGASCDGDCVVTEDLTPIEPGHVENKYYAPGIGLILEVDPETGERVELVEYEIPEGRGARAGLGLQANASRSAVRAFPNPARSQVMVLLALAQQGQVSADVYDASGRKIRSLDGGSRDAGNHLLRWDGRDDQGRPAAAGMYFVRVRAGAETFTRSAVLAR